MRSFGAACCLDFDCTCLLRITGLGLSLECEARWCLMAKLHGILRVPFFAFLDNLHEHQGDTEPASKIMRELRWASSLASGNLLEVMNGVGERSLSLWVPCIEPDVSVSAEFVGGFMSRHDLGNNATDSAAGAYVLIA